MTENNSLEAAEVATSEAAEDVKQEQQHAPQSDPPVFDVQPEQYNKRCEAGEKHG